MSISMNLHGIKYIGVNTRRICPEDGGKPYTNMGLYFVDKNGRTIDISLIHCEAEVEFIGAQSSFDFTQEKKLEERDASLLARLTPKEREISIQWARDRYTPGTPIDIYWCPVVKQECEVMNQEIQNELREEV